MKYIWRRFWVGFGTGVLIGDAVTIIVSYSIGNGAFLPVMPQLSSYFTREVDAVLVQFLLFGMIGAVFAEAGILFTVEKWSFPLRCLVHFGVTAVFYIPFLWICYFQQEQWWKLLILLGNILFTYVLTWSISYRLLREEVENINRRIEQLRNERKKDDDGGNQN